MAEHLKPFKSQLDGLSDKKIAEHAENGKAMRAQMDIIPENSLEALAIARQLREAKRLYYGKGKKDKIEEVSDSHPTSNMVEATDALE